jgi:hypothetical protein
MTCSTCGDYAVIPQHECLNYFSETGCVSPFDLYCRGLVAIIIKLRRAEIHEMIYIYIYIYMLCRQMYTVLCYLTQFLLNVAQHVSSLYKAHLQGLFR